MFIDDYSTFLTIAEPSNATPSQDHGLERIDGGSSGQKDFDQLQVEHLSFTYPSSGRQVLTDINLEVRAGEIVALVGENGSGKTTLVKLICQLYKPDAGTLRWNSHDAANLDPEGIRARITVLFQDFIHYHLSALDNIALGRIERPIETQAIESAARQAGAHGFVSQLPGGYKTRLGLQFYGGHELSVGQWQRLALARAFYRGGSFLILDEPTASLDPRAEYELFKQMRELAEGRSVLLISHRFSSVRSADRIYVMHDGRITESGTHDELLKLGGRYAELYGLQAAAHLGGPARVED
jgi:ATP-binding cassette subfamily B protein